jgi:hypothetical protein
MSLTTFRCWSHCRQWSASRSWIRCLCRSSHFCIGEYPPTVNCGSAPAQLLSCYYIIYYIIVIIFKNMNCQCSSMRLSWAVCIEKRPKRAAKKTPRVVIPTALVVNVLEDVTRRGRAVHAAAERHVAHVCHPRRRLVWFFLLCDICI